MDIRRETQQLSFLQWIWKTPINRLLLLISVIAIMIQFVIFKWLYPYPNFLPDSYSYLVAALTNQTINIWPIGYSKFLRLFSCFSYSHLSLVLFQYIFLHTSILYLFYSIVYWFNPRKWVLYALFFCNLLNPLIFYVSNFVSSDAIFASLSILWFTQLFWLYFRPDARLLIFHAFVLLMVFTTRYNALYYPIFSVMLIIAAPMNLRSKLIGTGVIILLLGLFIGQTIHKYQTVTGISQFSAFGGWQLASNALFAYAKDPSEDADKLPGEFRPLHANVNHHIDSLRQLNQRPDAKLGIYYLWDEKAPLKQYMYKKYSKDNSTEGFKQWASMAPLYMSYGTYLINHHKGAFVKNYVWPNLINYYVPPAEFLGIYNMETDTVEQIATVWFGLKTNKIRSFSQNKRIVLADIFTVSFAIVNLLFVLTFISFLALGGIRKGNPFFKKSIWIMLLIWLSNLGFSVFASPIVLRYQVFPFVIAFCFLIFLLDFIIQESLQGTERPGEDAYM